MYDEFLFDNFFDLPEKSLPRDCEYYFNVLTIIIAAPVGRLAEWTGIEGITEWEDLSHVKDPRPVYLYFYEDNEVQGGLDIEATSHTVVEFNTRTREVAWYDMLDFETESPWAIEPIEEDFDYDEEDE